MGLKRLIQFLPEQQKENPGIILTIRQKDNFYNNQNLTFNAVKTNSKGTLWNYLTQPREIYLKF